LSIKGYKKKIQIQEEESSEEETMVKQEPKETESSLGLQACSGTRFFIKVWFVLQNMLPTS
jgi:hypothetical protein